MPYVYSTLTNPQLYTEWVDGPDGRKLEQKQIRIEGGHGLMNKNFVTPQGVVTEVSDADLEFLMTVNAFKFHMEGGFISVQKRNSDPEKVSADMTSRDESAQLTPADYSNGRLGVDEPTVTGGQ